MHMSSTLLTLTLVAAAGPATPPATGPDLDAPPRGLTAVPGILVGHHTLEARPTGCTVIVAERGAVGGVDVRGGGPGTREIALLRPENLVETVNAVVLAGGSAFGLDAAGGAVRWLEEHGHGYDTRVAKVPIVPAAILFDLTVGDASVRPDAACGYRAAEAASSAGVEEGNVGAGAGATVGKLAGRVRSMKGGLGSEDLRFGDGLVVAALAAVNAVGTVVDPSDGSPVAGVRSEDGSRVLRPEELLLADRRPDHGDDADDAEGADEADDTGDTDDIDPFERPSPAESTTLVVVATNAPLTKAQATKVAQMAHDGLARTIVPVHTPFDGDIVFVLATGEWTDAEGRPRDVDLLRLGSLAAEVTARAVLRAVRRAEGLPGLGLPSASDMAPIAPSEP